MILRFAPILLALVFMSAKCFAGPSAVPANKENKQSGKAAVSAVSGKSEKPLTAEDYYNKAYYTPNAKEQMSLLKQAINTDPFFAKGYNFLGWIYAQQKNKTEAIKYYDLAIKYDATNPAFFINRGKAQMFLGEPNSNLAVKDVNFALNVDAYYKPAYRLLGLIHKKLGSYNEAVDAFTTAIGFEGDESAEDYYERGDAYKRMGNYEEFAYDCKKAIEINPGYALAYAGYGEALLALGRIQDGLKNLNKAVSIDPKTASAHRSLGYYNLKLWETAQNEDKSGGKYGLEAKEHFETLAKLAPNDPETYLYLGVYSVLAGNKDAAVSYLKKAFTHGYEGVEQLYQPDDGFGTYYKNLWGYEPFELAVSKQREFIRKKYAKNPVTVELPRASKARK